MSDPLVATSRTVHEDRGATIRVDARGHFHGDRQRSFRRNFHRTFQRDEKLTVEEVTKTVSGALYSFPAKEIVEATGGSLRAAENVRQGMNAMSLTAFLNACRSIPELRAVAMQLMGCEAESDPEFVRGLQHLINSHIRREATQ